MALLVILVLGEWYLSFQLDQSVGENKYRMENVYNGRGDDILGWTEEPNSDRIARKIRIHDNTPVYEVAITTDEYGLRIAPPYNQSTNSGGRSLVFFGCSVTFGEGVNNHEAMPYTVGILTHEQYQIYNFGTPGYGPQHMLAAIEHGLVDPVIKVKPHIIMYQGIIDHVHRVANLNHWEGSPYSLGETGELVYARDPAMCNSILENCFWKEVKKKVKKSLLVFNLLS